MREKRRKIYLRSLVPALFMALAVGTASPAAVKAAPAKPVVTLVKRTKKTAKIQMKKQGNVSGYQIFFKTSKKGKFRQIMGVRSQSYTIKNLKPKKNYYVKVRAFKTKNYRVTTGPFSKVITISPYKKKVETTPVATPAPTSEPTSDVTAAPTSEPTPDITAAPTTTPSDTAKFAEQVLELVNQERTKEGLQALVLDDMVMKAANVRAKELIESFSHERPVTGASPFTALTEAGCTYGTAGENIAAGQRTPKQVVEAWMDSKGHRANILNADFRKLGVGYATANDIYGHYWVQLFTD